MFSKIINKIPEALSIYFNQIVYDQKSSGVDIITLSLGEAYFDIPLFDFKNLDLNKIHHYTSSLGLEKLRQKLSKYYLNNYKSKFDHQKEILISTGSKPLIYMAIKSIIDPGDEVVVLEPAWLSYKEQITLCGGKTKFINFDENIENINKYISNKTKLIIVNNPNNPSGKIYSKKELKYLIKFCIKKKIWLLVDEAYSDFVSKNFMSALHFNKSKKFLIVVNSLSKNLGISGWRIGYIISNKSLIDKILILNQHIITCAPSILMYYLAEYFEKIIKITKPQIKLLLQKRDNIRKILDKKKIKYLKGDTTFYFFIDLNSYKINCYNFCMYLLLKEKIAVVPGKAYGDNTENFIRMSIGTETEDRILYAIDIIKKVLKENKFEKELIYLKKKFNIKKIN